MENRLTCYQKEYTAIDTEISIRPALFKEAQMLFRVEASNDCILSVVAIGLVGATCVFEGWDTLGLELSMARRPMAERFDELILFDELTTGEFS